jgi:serine/threonine protein kinase
MTYRIRDQLGNYRLLRLLGRGAFAEVYLGEHLYLKSQAALKVLHTSLEEEDVEQFLAEGQTLARLRHPNIVRVLEFFVDQGTPVLVMDYAPSATIRQRYPRGSYLSLETTVTYVKQIASALQYAHNLNVIHRDIKPENILLGSSQNVMLSDFGIALLSPSPELLSTQDMAGTLPYMAPEQLRGKPGFASDQYSLGVVVYEWLCGVRPFEGSYWQIATQHVSASPPSMREKDPSLPEAVEKVVLRALAKDPQQRYVSVQMFARALELASQQKLVSERELLEDSQPTSQLDSILRSPSGPPKRVFLSASPADGAFTARLQADLQRRGINVWNAGSVSAQKMPDESETVRQAIRAADVVLLVASPQARASRTLKDHLRIADIYKRRIVFVWADGSNVMEALPLVEEKATLIDARQTRYERALDEIVSWLDRQLVISDEPTTPLPAGEPRNPYKGLRSFTTKDARDFFGRETYIHELIDMLKDMLTSQEPGMPGSRLLTVIGPSGSGKSSVVMAGLLPKLQRGIIPGSEEWIYLEPMVPGAHPTESLVLTLAPRFSHRSMKSIREDLEDDLSSGFHLLATQLVQKPGQKVVLLIDQFDELFTLTASEKERQHFIDLLVTAAKEELGPVIIILTLRADFYDRPMSYQELGRLILRRQSVILPMELHDLRAVIRQPAALADVRLNFEGSLVGDLLFDVQGQIGALPLLQFTLDLLFERRRDNLLTLQAYQEIGGVKGALAKHAEATYAALPSDEHRRLARSLFLRLIDPGLTEQDTTRRRAALTELTLSTPKETEMLQSVASAFLDARLLTTNEVVGTPTIEVSHEALIREWSRLADWLWEAREDIHLQQALSKDVAEWERRDKPRDRLYRGSQLAEARVWAKHNTPSKSEITFLRASTARGRRFRVATIATVLLVLLLSIPTYLVLRPYFVASVTNLNDDGPGSLRQAIATASPGSTITFDSSLNGTIVLSSGDLNFNKSLTVRGPGANILSITRNNVGTKKIHIILGASVTISGLTFTGLNDSGFKSEANLTLIDSVVSANSTPGDGGGIESTGTLVLINTTITGNRAVSTGTPFDHNKDFGNGGGIANHGVLRVINSRIFGNVASTDGGGVYNEYKVPTVSTISNSTIFNNTACRGGGGIFIRKGDLALNNTTVSNNKVGNCVGYTLGRPGLGGGIKNFGTLTLTNSTVSANTTPADGGGIYSGVNATDVGMLTLTNSTVSGNTSSGGSGGGIEYEGSQATITFCTLYGNTALNGGGISIGNNTTNQPVQVTLRNSLVAANHATTGPDILGNLISNGYNLIQDPTGTSFTPNNQHTTDIMNVPFSNLGIDPKLSGKPAQTHALLKGSPAIDTIPLDACQVAGITTDQRGVKRPQGPRCDIGAYEYIPS